MNNHAIYIYRHLGKFKKEAFSISPEGIQFENKQYKWTEIAKIKRYDSFLRSLLFYQAGAPLTYIYFRDKKVLKIRGRVLEKSGEKGTVGSLARSSAYEEVIQFIENKMNEIKKAV